MIDLGALTTDEAWDMVTLATEAINDTPSNPDRYAELCARLEIDVQRLVRTTERSSALIAGFTSGRILGRGNHSEPKKQAARHEALAETAVEAA